MNSNRKETKSVINLGKSVRGGILFQDELYTTDAVATAVADLQ